MKVPPVNCKVFERTTILKNGTSYSLKVTSEAPRKFQFDMIELNSKQEVPRQYHLATRLGDIKTAYMNYSNIMDKLDRVCKDDNIIKDITAFFKEIL